MDLKPCPFCGGKARSSVAGNYVKCHDPRCTLGLSDAWMKKETWNTREADKRIKKIREAAEEMYVEDCWHCSDGSCSKCNAFRNTLGDL